MDLQDQLRNFFPNHKFSESSSIEHKKPAISHTQTTPLYVNMKREMEDLRPSLKVLKKLKKKK